MIKDIIYLTKKDIIIYIEKFFMIFSNIFLIRSPYFLVAIISRIAWLLISVFWSSFILLYITYISSNRGRSSIYKVLEYYQTSAMLILAALLLIFGVIRDKIRKKDKYICFLEDQRISIPILGLTFFMFLPILKKDFNEPITTNKR